MWKTWAHVSTEEVEALKANAVYKTGILKDGLDIPNAFALSMFDHNKCQSTDVRIHTKQELKTTHGRDPKFSSALWNVQRPYMKCSCRGEIRGGCKGDIIWFDQAVWYIINHLDSFFNDEFATLQQKFKAFLVWLTEAGRMAIRHQITFNHSRDLMIEAAVQYAHDPNARLLPEYPEKAAGIRYIEFLMKPAHFSAAHSAMSSATKKARTVNLNVSPDAGALAQTGTHGHGRGGTRGGRGGYNRNYHSGQTPYVRRTGQPNPGPNDAFVFFGSSARRPQNTSRQYQSPDSNQLQRINLMPTQSNVSITPHRSPILGGREESAARSLPRFNGKAMKGRCLDWEAADI
jgi:hypothetical protein